MGKGNQEGVEVKTANHAIDLVIDTTAGTKRIVRKLSSMASAGNKRARRVAMMANKVRAAAKLGTAGVVLVQSYANSAMGACPRITKMQKSNLSIASGMGLHV